MRPGKPGKSTDRILVTGHKGYIGSVLVNQLLAAGYKNITGIDSNLFRNSLIKGDRQHKITDIIKDIRDVDINDLKGFDVVIHLAGLSNDPLGYIDKKLTYEINYEATERLAMLSREAGIRRFIFSSTCSVYGGIDTGKKVNEELVPAPLTPYAESKLLAEKAISQLADSRFCPVILRNATVYGVSPQMRFDLVVNNLVAGAYITGEIVLESDGTAWRPLVHVKDVCKAVILMISTPNYHIWNRIFNVGDNNQNYQIINIARHIKEKRFAHRIRFKRNSARDFRTYNVSFDRIIKCLPEFASCIQMSDGINEVYSYLQDKQLSANDILGPGYIRIDNLKKMLGDQQLSRSLRWV